jgi:hypothetical protein
VSGQWYDYFGRIRRITVKIKDRISDKNIVIWKEYSKIHSMIAIFFSFQIFFFNLFDNFFQKGVDNER